MRKIGGDSGGIHTNLGGTRFTLRENSGVHSRTSKSRNSISAANRSRQTCEKEGKRKGKRGKENERENDVRRLGQMMEFTIIFSDMADG